MCVAEGKEGVVIGKGWAGGGAGGLPAAESLNFRSDVIRRQTTALNETPSIFAHLPPASRHTHTHTHHSHVCV